MVKLIEKSKPYVAMISLQFGYAGMVIISKIALNRGMDHFVLVVYRHAVATVVLAPFAFFFERINRPKLRFSMWCQLFVLGLLGPVIDQNFFYLGLKLTSPTYAITLINVLPAMTFVLALLFRTEKVDMRKVRSQAKIAGTILSVGGALLMTFCKGPVLNMLRSPDHQSQASNARTKSPAAATDNKEWITGSLLILASTLSWSGLFLFQAIVQKTYYAPLSLATLICFIGTLQATVIALPIVRDLSKWSIAWDVNLLSAVYAGVFGSAVAYYLQGVCMRLKGPVFATAFTPLMMIIVAIMGTIILSERIYLGSVLGGIMILIGLYAVLWGKLKDSKLSTDTKSSEEVSHSPEMTTENENEVEDMEAASNQVMPRWSEPHQTNAARIR